MKKTYRRRFFRFLKREGAYAAFMKEYENMHKEKWHPYYGGCIRNILGAFSWYPNTWYWLALSEKWVALLNLDYQWKHFGLYRFKCGRENHQNVPKHEQPLWGPSSLASIKNNFRTHGFGVAAPKKKSKPRKSIDYNVNKNKLTWMKRR